MRARTLSRWIIVAILAFASVPLCLGAGTGVGAEAPATMPQRYVLFVAPEVPPAQSRALIAQAGLAPVRYLPQLSLWIAEAPSTGSALTTSLATLAAHPEILKIEADGRAHIAETTPNDSFYQAQQWNLPQIHLPEAWDYTVGSSTPIAIVDTGIDLDHPDLAAKLWINPGEIPDNSIDDDHNGYIDDWRGWDFVEGDNDPQDLNGHGSHVAGIAGAQSNNGIGIAGVSWNAGLMAVRVLNSDGYGWWSDIASGILYAADAGARVINLSLGDTTSSGAVEEAIAYARERGCLIVAAAGNKESQPILYPAALDGVMAVAATGPGDSLYPNGNRGPQMDVAAPGMGIFSTWATGSYCTKTGTSMATPHVSGLANLIWTLRPWLSADEVAAFIENTAVDIGDPGWDERTGWGRIDALEAVAQAAELEDLELSVEAEETSLLPGREHWTSITATVTYSGGLPAPDGLMVHFAASRGEIDPTRDLWEGETATCFWPTRPGTTTITASLSNGISDTVQIYVERFRQYLPVFYGRLANP